MCGCIVLDYSKDTSLIILWPFLLNGIANLFHENANVVPIGGDWFCNHVANVMVCASCGGSGVFDKRPDANFPIPQFLAPTNRTGPSHSSQEHNFSDMRFVMNKLADIFFLLCHVNLIVASCSREPFFVNKNHAKHWVHLSRR